ncbi:PadR family transcriptional regulator [Demequina litorisediminis]|uniref:DNA-binding protein YwzG n=1 Tax=Demequina litorisediminis TaxID=1849022 RepID=A0ABQ6IDN6_9MICO|nr:helix-turn-helix transcriptional regulator [Demequina litorisediminis]GMA35311.1 putative DNA-binding protein YwzG [Demequina litorisediminis]
MDIPKDLVAASAAPMVLSILAESDSYGYAILGRVREPVRGRARLDGGAALPLLHRLERQGHIEATWGSSETGRRRKYYALTGEGREALATHVSQWRTVAAALESAWGRMDFGGQVSLA